MKMKRLCKYILILTLPCILLSCGSTSKTMNNDMNSIKTEFTDKCDLIVLGQLKYLGRVMVMAGVGEEGATYERYTVKIDTTYKSNTTSKEKELTLKYNCDKIDLKLLNNATYVLYLKDRGGAYEPVVIDDVIGAFQVENNIVLDYFGTETPLSELTS